MNKLPYKGGPHTGSRTGVSQIIDDCSDYCAKTLLIASLQTDLNLFRQCVMCKEELQRLFLLCTFHLLPIFYNHTLWKGEEEQQVM